MNKSSLKGRNFYMPTRYDKEFKQNIINLYKQGESAYIQQANSNKSLHGSSFEPANGDTFEYSF